MARATKKAETEIDVARITLAETAVWILGTSPLLMNRLAEKARQELLLPSPRKNQAQKASTLKHRPYDEYRSSVYRQTDGDGPTRLVFPGGGLRKAIASAALDIPGATRAQVGRLVRVAESNLSVYGVPKIYCAIIRQGGINKTPDVRTRAILPEWCARATIRFAFPLLKQPTVFNLLEAAGEFIGIGDGRGEKGSSLSCGCFRIATADDMEDVERICAAGGRAAQDRALAEPEHFDYETEELLGWFDDELARRGGDAAHLQPDEEDEEDEELVGAG